MATHTCIRPGCGNSYQDNEEDDYYCPSCNTARKLVAKEMDSKFNTKGQKPNGLLHAYDQALKGRKFPLAADLGL